MMKWRTALLALALAVAVTLAPPVGTMARAEEDAEAAQAFIADKDGAALEIGGEPSEEIATELPGDFAFDLDEEADFTPDDTQVVETATAAATNSGGFELGNGGMIASNATVKHSVKITQSGSTVTVKGTVPAPYSLFGLLVDDQVIKDTLFGTSINETINMDSGRFATGYHTVAVFIVTGTPGNLQLEDTIIQKYMAANLIKDVPTYKGRFEVYSSYFNFYPYDMALQNQRGDLYMEYSSDGGKTWKRSGYMRANLIKLYVDQGYEINGLKAKTKYKTRIRYGQYVNYAMDGKDYLFLGPALNTTTITTGASKKPSIKSVTAQATSVKYHKVKHYGPYTGVYLYTEKFYTCKIKVTVKLKKKPGTKGLWIGCAGQEKFVKGNSTTYTVTFSPYPNYFAKKPKGHYKYTVTVRSGQSKTWGGYSPKYSKSKKLS